MAPDDPIAVYPNRQRIRTAGLLLGGLALSSLFVAVVPAPFRAGLVERWILGVGSIVLGAFAALMLERLRRARPLLVVSRDGIDYDWGLLGKVFIEWSNVRKVTAFRFMGQRFIGVVPVSRQALLSRRGPLARGFFRLNFTVYPTPVVIPESVLPIPSVELLAVIERFRPR